MRRIPYTVLLLIWGGVVGLVYMEFDSPFNPALNSVRKYDITIDLHTFCTYLGVLHITENDIAWCPPASIDGVSRVCDDR